MAADNINNIIDVSGFDADLGKVITGISTLEAKMDEANGKAIHVIADFKGLDNLNALIDGTKQYGEVLADLQKVKKDSAKITEDVAIIEQKAAIVNLNNIDKKKAAAADLLRSQEAYGDAYITLLEKEEISEQAAAIKNLNNINKKKAAAADLLRSQQAFGDAYIQMLEKQNAAQQANTQKIVDANVATFNSLAGLRAEMVRMKLAGEDQTLPDLYLLLAERANIAATAVERVNNAIKNPTGLAEAQNAPIVGGVSEEGSAQIQTTEEKFEQLRNTIAATTAAKVEEATATKEETIANEQQIASQQAVSEALTGTSLRVRQLENDIEGMEALLKMGGKGVGFDNLKVKVATLKTELAGLKSETVAGQEAITQSVDKTTMGYQMLQKAKNMALRFPALLAEIAVMTILFEAITKISEVFNKTSDAELAATERLKDYNDQIKELKKTLNALQVDKAVKSDVNFANGEELLKQATNTKLLMDNRIDGYNKLKDLMPQVLKNFTQEQVLRGDANKVIGYSIQKYSDLKGEIDATTKIYEDQAKIYEINAKKKADLDARRDRNPDVPQDERLNSKVTQEMEAMDATKQHRQDLQQQLEDLTAPVPKVKKLKKEKSEYEIKKRAIEAEFELNKRRIEGQRDAAKEILDNEKLTLKERYKANFDYQASLIDLSSNELNKGRKLNDLDVTYKKENPKTALDKNKAEALKYENDFQKIKADGIARIDAMQTASDKKWVKSQKDKFDEAEALQLHNDVFEENALNDRLRNNLISQEDYETELDKLLEKRKEKSLQAQIEFDKTLLYSGKITDDERAALKKKIAELEAEIAKLSGKSIGKGKAERPSGAFPELEQGFADLKAPTEETPEQKFARELDALKNFSAQSIEIYQELAAAEKQIEDNKIAVEQQNLEIKSRAIQLAYQEQVDAVNASAGYQITKENELAKMAAQNAAQQNAIQQRQNQLALKKAISDKTAAEAGIIANTALAITKALPMLATPATAAIGAAEIALISAIGAVQYAAAASTPLPQFWKGGDTYTEHFIAGELGPERMTTPSGEVMFANKPGIYSAPIGTHIDTAAETAAFMRYAQNSMSMSINSRGELKEHAPSMTDKRIVEKLDEVIESNYQVAMMQRTIKNNITVTVKDRLQIY